MALGAMGVEHSGKSLIGAGDFLYELTVHLQRLPRAQTIFRMGWR